MNPLISSATTPMPMVLSRERVNLVSLIAAQGLYVLMASIIGCCEWSPMIFGRNP